MTTTAIPGSPGYGEPNGILDNEDFFYEFTAFAYGVGVNVAVWTMSH